MSGIPDEIPELGNAKSAPRQNPEFSPDAGLSPEDYFVWTRCDGRTSLRDIILMVGMGSDKVIGILRRLRTHGAVMMEGETPATVAARRAQAQQPRAQTASATPRAQSASGTSRAQTSSGEASVDRRRRSPESSEELPSIDAELENVTPEEESALAEQIALDDIDKRRILAARRKLRGGTYFDLLGVDGSSGKRELKRAYFRMSKAFHPDRYYQKNLGSFRPWLTEIFETMSRAFAVLSDEREKAAYLASLRGEPAQPRKARGQTREEHAQELFDTACERENSGDLPEAMKLFAAAVRVDPQPRYLRRAATCGVKAGELTSSESYARAAFDMRPKDASYARVLADVYRAQERWSDAEAVLTSAIEHELENDALARELKADLAMVRGARNRGP